MSSIPKDTEIDRIAELLTHAEVSRSNRIPESLFVGLYLPFFANMDNQHPTASLATWLLISGGPYFPVTVFDNSGDIFTVPPLFCKEAIDPAAMTDGEPLSHIIAVAEQLSRRNPIEGHNYLDNKFTTASNELTKKIDLTIYGKEWNAIFKRYGVDPLIPELSEDNSTKVTLGSDIIDDLRGDNVEFTPI